MRMIEGGFPHSEMSGSKPVRGSPNLIAAYHVLHRLSAPRHPPNTLKALDRSHYRCSPLGSGRTHSRENTNDTSIERPFASNASENVAVKQTSTCWYARRQFQISRSFIVTRSDALPLHDVENLRRRVTASASCFAGQAIGSRASSFDAPLVEPDGIEPTTSCLQSTRSPN